MHTVLSIHFLISIILVQNAYAAEIPTAGDRLDGRIIGGWQTSILYFPYQVSLQIRMQHGCGGTIISPTIILTAAHCVMHSNQTNLYSIRAGSNMWSQGGIHIRVKRIIPHEQFNQPTRLNNDIALIQLQKALVFSNKIQPILLDSSENVLYPQMQLYISGWGSTATDDLSPTNQLRFTTVVQFNQRSCSASYAGAGVVTNNMICAGTPAGGHDSCQGDSGGPMVITLDGKQPKLYGIVSWGLSCANPNFPGVYTKVRAYTDWVANKLKLLS